MWNTALIFSNKNHGLQEKNMYKKQFSVGYVKITDLHIHTDVTCNLSRWNNGGSDIYKKRSLKTKTLWKNSFLK